MNKIYKVIWSKTRNCYVAVSEIAKRNGKNCTSVNCGGKANRTRSLHMAAVTLGVTAALFAGSSCFGTPAAWAASSGNSVEVTTGNPDYVYGGYANSTAPPSGRIVGGYSTTVTDAADSNTVTIGGVNVNNRVFGGYSAGGNANLNNLTINSGATIGEQVFGGNSGDYGNGNADQNKVTINGGQFDAEVNGGYSLKGNARDNQVIINGGTLKSAESVYGGQVGTGNATGNIVNISQSSTEVLTTINGTVYGGYSYSGNAGGTTKEEKGNKVSISGGTLSNNVYGGYAFDGTATASYNSVEISNGTLSKDVYGGFVYGGTGTAGYNNVKISGSTVRQVYGGQAAGTGNATGNIVNISQSSTEVLTTINGFVYGGNSYNGNVSLNEVTFTGGSVKGISGGHISDNNSSGVVSGNKVTLDGSDAVVIQESYSSGVCGGYNWGTGAATGNQVEIKNGATVNNTVYGGYTYSGAAGGTTKEEGNKVIISSGTVTKGVYGGYAYGSGSATGNKVDISQTGTAVLTTISGSVYGGYSANGNAGGTGEGEGNKVTISDGKVTQSVYGGYVNGGTGTAGYNSVEITGGNLNNAYGGYINSGTGKAEGNKVSISGPETTVNSVYGGWSNRNALNNSVTISGGTVNSSIYGGNASDGSASNNTVTITGNATIKSSILGGLVRSTDSGDATGNTVTISGSPNFMFEGSSGIWGGRTMGSGAAKNNTVNILSSIAVGFLIGGQSIKDPSNVSGNTLNVAAKNVTVGQDNVRGFQNMNFYLPANIAKDDTMLTVNSTNPTDVQGVTFGVAALSGVNLEKGNTVNLITNPSGLTTDDTLKTTDSATLAKASFLSANSLTTDDKYELSISKKGENTIIATVDNVTEQSADAGGDTSAVEEIKKSPVETRMGVVTMVNAGADLLAGQGMSNAADAAAAERSGGDGVAAARAGGFAPFAAVGLGNLRAKSGSHVDTKSIGLSLGFAREIENKSGKLLVGPVVEYGHGKYDSYQDNGITADGKSSYWGIGVIAKQTNHNGFYYEGSLRAGRTKSDYGSDSARPGNHVSYDSSATYWAAHLGAGKLFDIGHDNTLDVYGKYFYSHTGSDSTTIHIGAASEGVDFSAVNSHRIRLGARITHALNAKNKIYGGLAWQYEFNGDARAVYSVSGEAPSPSVKGSSGMLELGWQVKPGKSPMTIDLGVTGWVGKQRGITANLQANWTF